MNIAFTLTIETSTADASIMRIDENGGGAEAFFTSDRNHNAQLFGPLRKLLDEARPARLTHVIVGSGPASYSGTRVGIAAAQGIAIAHDCPAIAIPSILAVPIAASGAHCMALGDARRGHYWFAEIADAQLVSMPQLVTGTGLLKKIEQAKSENFHFFTLENSLKIPVDLSVRIKHEIPTARLLWQAWQKATDAQRVAWAEAIPQPIYLKPPHITPPKASASR